VVARLVRGVFPARGRDDCGKWGDDPVKRLNYREIREALRERKPFTGNSMSADYVDTTRQLSTGYMPTHDCYYLESDVHTARTQGIPFYVVWSYGTPIAWAYGTTVRVPEVRYSVTTSKQQGIARAYLA